MRSISIKDQCVLVVNQQTLMSCSWVQIIISVILSMVQTKQHWISDRVLVL